MSFTAGISGFRERAVVHLNVADFAVAVERVLDPGLRRRPLIVAPQDAARAMVYDMSEEAFQLGVNKYMPLHRARRLCRQARIVPPRLPYYQRAMHELLRRAQPYSPLVEAEEDNGHIFLDLSGTAKLFGPPQDVAWRIRRDARAELGLDPIWSLAPNKLVAKTASRVVKPAGEIIIRPGEEEDFLRPLPLGLLPGVERQDLIVLRDFNIWQVAQVVRWEPSHLNVVFGRRGLHLYRILRGQDDSPVMPPGRHPAAVRQEYEFAEDSNDRRAVEAALYGLVERAGAGLRRMGRVARRVTVRVVYSDGMRVSRGRTHPGTANDFTIFALARQALEAAWQRRVRLRHLGLYCGALSYSPRQLEFAFSAKKENKEQEDLLAALDRIRLRHGPDKIRLGRTLAA